MSGRPRAVDKSAVLRVIHDSVTVSPSELAKSLNVARSTVYRRLKEIKQEELDQALGIITEGELKPSEMEWELFQKFHFSILNIPLEIRKSNPFSPQLI